MENRLKRRASQRLLGMFYRDFTTKKGTFWRRNIGIMGTAHADPFGTPRNFGIRSRGDSWGPIIYPLVMTNIAIENDHWNSGFSHWKWWFSIVMLVYQRVWLMISTRTVASVNSFTCRSMSVSILLWAAWEAISERSPTTQRAVDVSCTGAHIEYLWIPIESLSHEAHGTHCTH